jgi:hypothetical protein
MVNAARLDPPLALVILTFCEMFGDICNLAILVVGFRSFAIMEIGFALLPFSTKGAPLQCLV